MKLKLLKIQRLFHLISKKDYNEKRQIEVVKNSPLFDKKWYLSQYPDVKNTKMGAAKHYVRFGWKEGRNPSPDFDNEAYLREYPELEAKGWCPLFHYMLHEKDVRFSVAKSNITKQVSAGVNNLCFKKVEKDYFFSVVVASYNYQDYIKETLDSLVNQKYKNFEVIVVDDGSSDNSVEVIKEYVNKYPFVYLYQHKNGGNRGLPETVALGVEKAKGEYIAFLESGDYWTDNHLREINKVLNFENNVQIVVNDVQTFGDEDRCLDMEHVIDYRKKTIISQKGMITDEQFVGCNYILTFSACCVCKKLLKICNFVDVPKKTALGWWLWRQICYKNRIFYIDEKLTHWRLHQSYNIRDIEGEAEKHAEFVEKLNLIMSKRKYESVYINNGRLSDIDDFSILEWHRKSESIVERISKGDFKGIKICYISTTGQTERPIGDGSTRYRCYHPAEVLSQKGAFVTVVPHVFFVKQLSYSYDVYIFHRPCTAELSIIKNLKKLGKILIADYDDLIFGNQKVAEQSSIFKNLNRSLETVTQQFLNNMNMLLQFNYISVSTEGLKKEVLAVYPKAKVFVVHNFIPESIIRLSNQMNVRERPKDRDILMYCTGTLSHNMDFKEVEETLLSCLEKDKKLKLYIFGVLNASERLLKSDRVFFHNVADYWDLFNHMSMSAFTIAPLEKDSRFNECKSNVKFLESSVAGATLLATPIGDMKRVGDAEIRLCEDVKDWESVILNRYDINIKKNIQNNFEYIIKKCSVDTFLREFISIFGDMEV